MAVIGLNNNVERNGTVYHLQTEDSGIQNPHIITHLFVDGTIVATKRISYEHLLKRDDLQRCVQTLMRWQHRQMYQELTQGTYDTPSLDSASRLAAMSSGDFLIPPASQDGDNPHTEPELMAINAEYRFGAKIITNRSLAEVFGSFIEGRQSSTTRPQA